MRIPNASSTPTSAMNNRRSCSTCTLLPRAINPINAEKKGPEPTSRWSIGSGFPSLPNASSYFQAGDANNREECRADPEPHHNFHFVASPEQKVIVQGTARDQAGSGPAEPAHLRDDA